MESSFSLIFVFLSLTLVVATHDALSPQQYWVSKLPNTPMPKVFKDLLKLGVNDHTSHKGKTLYFHPNAKIIYSIPYTKEDQLQYDPNLAPFFLEKNLRPSTKLTLHFPKTTSPATPTFLSREIAETLPFSSEKLSKILNGFSVKPGTLEAKLIEKTIKECEMLGIKGEEKYCATSLESMIDFSTSKLGKRVTPMSTEVEKETKLQEFTVSGVVKTSNDKTVVCHKQSYPYAVFYCHSMQRTRAYQVSLVGADGTRANAVGVCHTDTSAWNPKHLAFHVLKVKPGTLPVCHFLLQDTVVWVPKF